MPDTKSLVIFVATFLVGIVAVSYVVAPVIGAPRPFFVPLVTALGLAWPLQLARNFYRGRALCRALASGNVSQARKLLASMRDLRANPKLVPVLDVNESVALILEERYSEARNVLKRLDGSHFGANSVVVTNNIAWCDIHLGRAQSAADSLTPIIGSIDSIPIRVRPSVLNTMGVALCALGRFAEAVPLLEQAATTDAADVYGQATRCFYLGEAYSALGETAKAQAAYKRAIDECPTSKYAERARQKLVPGEL